MEGVYALVDPRDGAVMYVGESKDVDKRFAQHCKAHRKPCRIASSARLMKEWLFDLQPRTPEMRVLCEMPGSDAKARQAVEAEFIARLNPALNIKGTTDRPLGMKWQRVLA